MHILLEKRHLVLAALVATLGLAVFVNWYYTGTHAPLEPEGTAAHAEPEARGADGAAQFASGGEDAFAEMKLSREAARGEALEQLRAAAGAGDGSEEALAAAAAIDAISEASRMEADIESLVSAALGGSCIAVISENAVDVVVGEELLGDEAALRVNAIVADVCGDRFENIRISGRG